MPETSTHRHIIRRGPWTVLVSIAALVAACTTAPPQPAATVPPHAGGTVRVGIIANLTEAKAGTPFYDPGQAFNFSPLWRCCLTRTLLSYNGRPIEEGGAVVRPDLAVDFPTVSRDGTAWTFHLRPDIHYSPPLAERVIRAEDFITALEHALRDAGDNAPPFYRDIVGADEFMAGSVDTIAGVEAPNATTLTFRLRAAAGDFANRVALHPLAPIPAEALEAHRRDYAGFLVSSGPYMYEGAETQELGAAAAPAWDRFDPGHLTLVRNPSWSRATDPLRPAYVDRIEVTLLTAEPEEAGKQATAMIESGEMDALAEPAPIDDVRRYLADEALRPRLFIGPALRTEYLALNMALPPFDDVHVRRALNYVLNRGAAGEAVARDRGVLSRVAHHLLPDPLENNLLIDYDPYRSSGDHGDVSAAQDEMRKSKYDSNGDGSCDGKNCSVRLTPVSFGPASPVTDLLIESGAKIGVRMKPAELDGLDPRAHVGAVAIAWAADIPSASNFALILDQSEANDSFTLAPSLIGATPAQLRAWGYRAESVPSVDTKIAACSAAVGGESFLCWSELDQLLMERVVPVVPLIFPDHGWIVSSRITTFSADPEGVFPAIDQLQVAPDPGS